VLAAQIFRGRRSVTSILDVIPLDVSSHHRTGLKFRAFYELAKRSEVILTLSEFSAGRISERLGIDAGRIVVSPLPPRPCFIPASGESSSEDRIALQALGVRSPFFVTIADLEVDDPRKRIEWLPAVARRLHGIGFSLVAVGAGSDSISPEGWIGLGRQPDCVLAALYRSAYALVFSSAYEGQGLPPLEAAACGTPAVVMGNSSLTEIVGDAALVVEESIAPWVAAEGPHSDSDPGCGRLVEAAAELALSPSLRTSLATACSDSAGRFGVERFDRGLASAYGLESRE